VLCGNALFLGVRLNGIGPRWFVLDTGALSSVVDADAAREIGLDASGSSVTEGAGGHARSSILQNVTFDIGEARLEGLHPAALDLRKLGETYGRRLDGIVGSELFRRFVVEIDYEQRELSLFEPATYTGRTGAASLPLQFFDEHPYVRASVLLPGGSEIEGDFVIDSGSNFPLILLPSFIEAHGLRRDLPPMLMTFGRGVGGDVPLPVGRAQRLRLGGFTIERPVTSFPSEGRFGRRGKAGNIGAAVLRRFRVVFDYSRGLVTLEPNGSFADPYEFDMSGLALGSEAPEYRTRKVHRVLERSPAERAGVEPGDAIIAIDGRNAEDIPLDALREMLRAPGKTFVLAIRRGERTLTVTLRTRRLV
jgi:hypothetical protein